MRGRMKKAVKKVLASWLSMCMLATLLVVGGDVSAMDVVSNAEQYISQEEQQPLNPPVEIPKLEDTRTTESVLQIIGTGTTYYVSNSGNDNNDGMSPEAPWATVERVNNQILQPGDRVLFKAGDVWAPNNEGYAPEMGGGWPQWASEEGIATAFLKPQGSGTEQNPIIIGRYGSDRYEDRPIFNGMGKVNFTVHIKNMNHIVVEHLEVTNFDPRETPPEDHTRVLRGIYVENHGIEGNTMRDITVQHCFIKDINARYHHRFNNEGGIIVRSTKMGPYNFDGVYIRNNTIHNVDYGGIFFRNDNQNRGAIGAGIGPWIGSPNVVIENNSIDKVGGDGIVVSTGIGAIIQYNVVKDSHLKCPAPCAAIWNINSDDTLLQYNEAYLTRQDSDGQAYDADGGCNRTVYQYNYSHDNEGGFMLLCQWGGGDNRDGVIRYNISQNDRSKVIHFAGATNFKIYNNTFYAGPGNNAKMTYGTGDTATFNNNIFYNDGTDFSFARGSGHSYNNNLYYGIDKSRLPEDANSILADPMLYGPGTGEALYPLMITSEVEDRAGEWNGLVNEKLKGYKLMEGSPAIDAGIMVNLESNQVVPATKDFFGNALVDGKPDIGAHEFSSDAPPAIGNGTSWTFADGYSLVSGAQNWWYLLFSEENTPLSIIFDTPDSVVAEMAPSWRGTQWIFKKAGGTNHMEGNYPHEVVPVDESIAYITPDKMSLPVKGYRPHTMYNNGPNNMEPLAQHDRIGYGFLVPQSGVYNISGVARKVVMGGDGVDICIMVNDTQELLLPIALDANDTEVGISHDITVDLVKGDCIYFIADSKENSDFDSISWNPTVTYIASEISKPEIPKGSYFVDDSQVSKVNYTQMIPQVHLSETMGMDKTTHVAQNYGQGAAELTFMGTGIEVVSQMGPSNGEMEIALYKDEIEVERRIVSTKGDYTQPFFIAYDKKGLEYGEYKIVVTNKGPQMVLDGFIIDTKNTDGSSNMRTISVSSNLPYLDMQIETEDGMILQAPYEVVKGMTVTVKATVRHDNYTLIGFLVNGVTQEPGELVLTIDENTTIEGVLGLRNKGSRLDLSKAKVVTNNRHIEAKFAPEKAFDNIESDNNAYAPSYTNTFPLNGKEAPYLIVELPRETQITQTILVNKGMPAFRIKSYQVAFSRDGVNFTHEQTRTDMASVQESTISLTQPITATHLKITILEDDDNQNNFVLQELRVYGLSEVDKTHLAKAVQEAEQFDVTGYPGPQVREFQGMIEIAKMYLVATDLTQQAIDDMTKTLMAKLAMLAGDEVYISVECSLLGEHYTIPPQALAISNAHERKETGSVVLKELIAENFEHVSFGSDGKLLTLNNIRPTSWVILINNDRTNVHPDTRSTFINAKDVVRIMYSNTVDGSDVLMDLTNKDALVTQVARINTHQKHEVESDVLLAEAYNRAVAALKDGTLKQEEINSIASRLEKASTYAADDVLKLLKDRIHDVKDLDPERYTAVSYAKLQEAVQRAESVLKQEKITLLDVEIANSNLDKAILGLELIPGESEEEATTEEIQHLKDRVRHAESINPSDYTVESYVKVKEAITKAQEVLLQVPIMKEAVKQAEDRLNKAIAGLVPVSNGGNEDNGGSNVGGSGGISLPKPPAQENIIIEGIIIDKNKILTFKDEENIAQYAKEAVTIASALGIVNGVDGYFYPKQPVTRAEFVKMVVETLGLEVGTEYENVFSDIQGDEWYAPYMAVAYHNSILKGNNGQAKPNEVITRQDLVVILMRALELEYKETDKMIKDLDTISDYAKESVQTAYAYGLVRGMEGAFNPYELVSREMAVTVIVRAYKQFIYQR